MRLFVPPKARTHESLAIMWEKPAEWEKVKEYQIYLDGELHTTVMATDYTFEGLKPDTEYRIRVFAIDQKGRLFEKSDMIVESTLRQPVMVDITSYGAVGDGSTVNTRAIQAAVDACEENGMVYIPRGVFVSGSIFLKSNMSLYLEEGAKLLGSTNPADYRVVRHRHEGSTKTCYASLVTTDPDGQYENIMLLGKGEINGNGCALVVNEEKDKSIKRSGVICLMHVNGLYMKDITVREAPFWCVHPIFCNDMSVNNISVYTKRDEQGNLYPYVYNGDGLDIDSCKNVCVFNSFFFTQDDCLAVKSGINREGREIGVCSENIRISNCRFQEGFGVAMGSDMSGGVRNVLVQDCIFTDSFSIASVKCPRKRGGVIENVVYDNCSIVNNAHDHVKNKWFKGALYLDNYYSIDLEKVDHENAVPVTDDTPQIRNITFQNCTVYTVEGHAVYIAGLPESYARNITLRNVTATGKYGLFATNVDGLNLYGVTVTAMEGDDMRMSHIENMKAE